LEDVFESAFDHLQNRLYGIPALDFCPLWPRPAVFPRPEPIPRPTRGFKSLTHKLTARVRTNELNLVESDNIDLLVLKAAKLISDNAKTAKVYLSGEVKRKLTIQGLLLTKGARAAIEAAGGKVVEV